MLIFHKFLFHFGARFYTRADVTIALMRLQKEHLLINVRYILDPVLVYISLSFFYIMFSMNSICASGRVPGQEI